MAETTLTIDTVKGKQEHTGDAGPFLLAMVQGSEGISMPFCYDVTMYRSEDLPEVDARDLINTSATLGFRVGSGDWLYRALYQTGFASQPQSVSRDDGLRLRDLYITSAAHCAPPDNKPTLEEIHNCRPYLERELDLLQPRVVVALGKIAFDTYLDILKSRGIIQSRAAFRFAHNQQFRTAPGQPILLSSYHPSQQNTSTGKLTEKMLLEVFRKARKLAGI